MKPQIKFIGNVLDLMHRGWIKVILQDNGKVYLPITTKIKLLDKTENSEIIEVLEGYYKNQIAEVPYLAKNNKFNYSLLVNKFKPRKTVIIKISSNKLKIGRLTCEVILDKNILMKGKYFIKFPIKTKKELPSWYFNEQKGGSRFADTWLPLMQLNDLYPEKYLHFGSFSTGCITVKYNPRNKSLWTKIYLKIINSRIDDKNLCYLEIK